MLRFIHGYNTVWKYVLVQFHANLIDYMRDGENDLRFTHEINLTFLVLVNVSAGYSFYLLSNKFKEIEHYSVSLTFNFIKGNNSN